MNARFDLEDFLPFRLNVLAQEVSERLSEIYAKRFNLDIPQWRILANLASRGEMTAQERNLKRGNSSSAPPAKKTNAPSPCA
jgi:hypothetical protein